MTESLAKKQLILNLFEMNCVGHITHGLWRLPHNHRSEYKDLAYWLELARLAESGGFDAIFIADVLGAYDVYGDSPAPRCSRASRRPTTTRCWSCPRWRRSPSTSGSASPSRPATSRRSRSRGACRRSTT
nr:hypothetical protein GCM10025699_43340 [Microbacterium flavescens]